MAVNPDRVKKAFEAIESGNLRTLQLMIRGGVPADYAEPNQSRSLLSLAARYSQPEIFQWLVEQGADLTFRESCSWRETSNSLIECACARGASPQIVDYLLANADFAEVDLSRALLTLAAFSDSAATVGQSLLNAGANPNYVDEDNESCLFVAVCESAEDFALMLLRAGALPDNRSKSTERGKYTRKTAFEVGKLNGLTRFTAECERMHPRLLEKKPRIAKPKSIAACWEIINQHLSSHGAGLPAGITNARQAIIDGFSFDTSLSNTTIDDLVACWECHDGSSAIGIFPVPQDIAYSFLSLADAIEARKMLVEVDAIESPGKPSLWTHRIPVAENGAGDYWVVEVGGRATKAIARYSHETNRFSKVSSSLLGQLQKAANAIQNETLAFDPELRSLR